MGNVNKNNIISSNNNRKRSATLYVVRVGVMAGLLTALKFALSFVPNVEVVTLLVLVYASVFGMSYAVPATLIFCFVETAVYGVGSWVVLYFLYWPLLAVLASVILKKRRLWAAILLAAAASVLFGVLSACADTLFCVVNLTREQLGVYWTAYYLRGVAFDVVHVLSSVFTVGFLYLPLTAVAKRLAPKKPVLSADAYAREARALNTNIICNSISIPNISERSIEESGGVSEIDSLRLPSASETRPMYVDSQDRSLSEAEIKTPAD